MNGKLTRVTEADRVSELLGLPEEINVSDSLTTQVAKGLPTASFEKILEVMDSEPTLNLISVRAFHRAKTEKLPLSPVKSQVLYDFARACGDRSVRFDDKDIGIDWGLAGDPVLSAKDIDAQLLRDVDNPFKWDGAGVV